MHHQLDPLLPGLFLNLLDYIWVESAEQSLLVQLKYLIEAMLLGQVVISVLRHDSSK